MSEPGLVVKPTVKRKPKPYTPPGSSVQVSSPGAGAIATSNPLEGLIKDINEDDYNAAAPSGGKSSNPANLQGADKLIAEAKKWVGTPYAWGKSGPLGFDCSGFTQYVFKQMGINLPRVSYQQGQGGTAVGKSDVRAGDLLFWDNSPRNPGADHVAIALGNGMMISAPKPGDRVKIQAIYGNPWARRYL